MFSFVAALALSSHLAHAGSEIGTDKKFGIGGSTGDPYIAVTGKYWLNEKSGIVGTFGTTIVYQTLRVDYESNIVTFGKDWSFGQLPLYWHADLEVGAYTPYYGLYPRFAVGGGVGVALQFDSIPAEVFSNVGLTGGYSSFCGNSYGGAYGTGFALFCYINPIATLGGRWYF